MLIDIIISCYDDSFLNPGLCITSFYCLKPVKKIKDLNLWQNIAAVIFIVIFYSLSQPSYSFKDSFFKFKYSPY